MATVELWSTVEGKLADFSLEMDANGDLVATSDQGESLKFPGGLTKTEFNRLVSQHNKANDGIVARRPEDVAAEEALRAKTQKLLDSLE